MYDCHQYFQLIKILVKITSCDQTKQISIKCKMKIKLVPNRALRKKNTHENENKIH